MELAFAGTGSFALAALEALPAAGHQVRLVITQPDRPSGRGLQLTPPPVKVAAQRMGLRILQPGLIGAAEVVRELQATPVDVLIVVAYGQILPAEVLQWPRLGGVNVHASLLPKYRGAAPVAYAILRGDATTGVSIMQMDEALDTGPLWAQREVSIASGDTTASLSNRLAQEGASLLVETLPRLGSGASPTPQSTEGVVYARQLRKEDGRLSWSLPADEIDRRVRAYTPWPGTWVLLSGMEAKLIKGRVTARESVAVKPGEIVKILPRGIDVSTGRGIYTIEQLQLAGKRVIDAQEFARGRR